MKTQVSELAENRVRLDIEVPAGDVDHAFDHALSDLSRTVRVPGFRKGKAPKPLVMRQVGRDTVVEEALRDHLSGWYSRAVAVAGIDPIDRPTIDWTDGPNEGAPFAFTAEVEVKPPPEVKSYKGLEGVKESPDVPQEAVDAEIERLRSSVAELTAVERGAQDGDFLVIDFEGTMDGTPFDGGSGSQYAVELGAGRLRGRAGAGAGRHEGGGGARHPADDARGLCRRAPGRQGGQLPRQGERREGARAAGARRRVRDVRERVRHAGRAARRHPRARAHRDRDRVRAPVPLVGAGRARRRAHDTGTGRPRPEPALEHDPLVQPDAAGPRRLPRGLPASPG